MVSDATRSWWFLFLTASQVMLDVSVAFAPSSESPIMKICFRMIVMTGLAFFAGIWTHHLAAQEAPRGASNANQSSQAVAEEIGSLRNARVAIPMEGQKKELTFFSGSLSESERAELAKLASNVRIVSGLSPAAALARAEEAHGIDARYASPQFLARAKNLAWVQAMSAGVDRLVTIEPLASNDAIVLTNFRGVHGPAIADHAMAMLLTLTRDLGTYAIPGAHRRPAGESQPIALEGRTMLVVGIGGIGTEIAQRAHGFGMHVIGTRRSKTPGPAFIERVGQPNDMMAMLPEADVVAIAVPLTPETEGLFDDKTFAAMKPGAYLINIARGKIVETDALLKALKSGKLAGACLDVTDPEPLPVDHPLRSFSNVIVTPHMAGVSEVTKERGTALFRENMRRFGAGEPLLNVVDKKAGY